MKPCRNGHARAKSDLYAHPDGWGRCRRCRAYNQAHRDRTRRSGSVSYLSQVDHAPESEPTHYLGEGSRSALCGRLWSELTYTTDEPGDTSCRSCLERMGR